jgi:hypothetical protein
MTTLMEKIAAMRAEGELDLVSGLTLDDRIKKLVETEAAAAVQAHVDALPELDLGVVSPTGLRQIERLLTRTAACFLRPDKTGGFLLEVDFLGVADDGRLVNVILRDRGGCIIAEDRPDFVGLVFKWNGEGESKTVPIKQLAHDWGYNIATGKHDAPAPKTAEG